MNRGWHLLGLVALLGGCISGRDIAGDPRYPTDYVVGSVYRTRSLIFCEGSAGTAYAAHSDYLLVAADPTGAKAPPTVAAWEARPGNWPNVGTYLEPGTRIRLRKLLLEDDLEFDATFWVQGMILDGPQARRRVELFFVSRRRYLADGTALMPRLDPALLELVPPR